MINKRLELTDAYKLYLTLKGFTDTYEFLIQCKRRLGMDKYVEGIEEDLYNRREEIKAFLEIKSCPYLNNNTTIQLLKEIEDYLLNYEDNPHTAKQRIELLEKVNKIGQEMIPND